MICSVISLDAKKPSITCARPSVPGTCANCCIQYANPPASGERSNALPYSWVRKALSESSPCPEVEFAARDKRRDYLAGGRAAVADPHVILQAGIIRFAAQREVIQSRPVVHFQGWHQSLAPDR